MQVFRTTQEIRTAPGQVPELGPRLAWLIREFEAGTTCELGDLVNVIVAGAGDRLEDVNAILGFDLRDEPAENIESYAGWYELTLIVNGEGFGYWLFVPKDSTDPALVDVCASQLPTR